MIKLRRFAAVLMVALIAGACRPGEGTREKGAGGSPATPSPADEAAIRAADSAFAAAATAGNVDGVVSQYANDAVLLAPNLPPQKGRDAIRSFWGGFLGVYTVRFELGSDTIDGRDDLAYNIGHYRFTAVPKAKGAPGVADEGKYVVILKKQPDGKWKIAVDTYSSNLALQH